MYILLEWKSAYGDMGVAGASLGVSGGENGVDEHECADDLSAKSSAFAVAGIDRVGTAAEGVVGVLHESLHQPNTTDGTQALCHHVQYGPNQRHLTGQEQPKRNRRVYVAT